MKKKRLTGFPRGVETILVVDDENTTIDVVREMLCRFGYTILTAEDGERAVEIYRSKEHLIDLVILDLNMPRMDGHACLRELRKLNPDVKVIISSGYSSMVDAHNLLDSGAAAFMNKPYRLQEILHRLREILDGI